MFELFTISKKNTPPSKENRNTEIQENSFDELSINHFWDLYDLFKGEEEPNLEEIQTTQHTHHMRSKGSVAQSNSSISNNVDDTPGNSQKQIVIGKAVTTNITINKNHSPINTTIKVEIDFYSRGVKTNLTQYLAF